MLGPSREKPSICLELHSLKLGLHQSGAPTFHTATIHRAFKPVRISPQDARMASSKAAVISLVVSAAAMLASQAEAFIPISTCSELQRR